METNLQETIKEQENTQVVDQQGNVVPQGTEEKQKQNHHNSATYAASLAHSAVKHVHPHHKTGIDL